MNNEVNEKLWNIATTKKLSTPFFLEMQQNHPIHPKTIFETKNKFFLELGSGWGEVAVALALKQPEFGFILLEKKPDRIRKTLKKIEKNKLENIRFLTANFNWFLTEFFERESFDEILLNFPDPWPKSKHHKHRTFDENFPDKLYHLLKPGGRFRFASDYGAYGRQVLRILRKKHLDRFTNPSLNFQRPDFPISIFENEKKEEGKLIYYIETYKK